MMGRLVAIIILVMSGSCAFAQDRATDNVQDSALYTGVHFGLGHIRLGTDSDRSFGFNLSLGYRFGSGLLVETGFSGQSSDDIFGNGDSLDLNREDLMLGYQIRLGDTLRLIPKVGRVRWDLDARDDALINFSSNDGSRELGEGSDDIAELVFEFRLGDMAQLDISYEELNYSFGESDLAEVGLRFEY
jgi:hypothetical protein